MVEPFLKNTHLPPYTQATMSEKHLVCQGAICKCKYGAIPDKLKVLTHTKESVNDKNGTQKLTASSKDTGATFEQNTFGPCQMQPLPGGGYKPCQATVTQWKGFYDKFTLTHGGKVLLEDSKATCPIGGPDCIEIIFHGQVAEITQPDADKADEQVLAHLFPFGRVKSAQENQQIPRN